MLQNDGTKGFAQEGPLAPSTSSQTANGTPSNRVNKSSSSLLRGVRTKRAVVIGAGLGGLATAIHLARRGWQVDVFERNAHCGGRMNVLEEAGFRIDMGPTMLMMPQVLQDIFTVCGRDPNAYLPMQRLQPAYRIFWPDGTKLDMGGPMENLLSQVRSISPEDVPQLPRLFGAMRQKYENARYRFIERSFNSLGDLLHPSTLVGLLKALPLESVYKMVSRYLHNEKLREAFTFQTLYLGISPFECPSIYALLPYIEMEFGVWFPKGGTISLARALAQLLCELGGRIHTCAPVKEVILEGSRAAGVRLNNGTTHRADVVICNADLPTAYRHLVPSWARRRYTDASLANRDYGCSGFLIYLGLKDVSLHEIPHNAIVLSKNYREVMEEICRKRVLPSDPAMHLCVPTHTDPALAPHGHHILYILVPCPNTQADISWETVAPTLRNQVLKKLEELGLTPNLEKHIVLERWFTPVDFERLYGCYVGAAYGGLTPKFLQSAYFRPHNRSEDVEGLYFVGASTHPGGGVPIVLTCGKLVAEEIEKVERSSYAKTR